MKTICVRMERPVNDLTTIIAANAKLVTMVICVNLVRLNINPLEPGNYDVLLTTNNLSNEETFFQDLIVA